MRKKILIISLVFILLCTFTACHDPNEDVLDLAVIVSSEDIGKLDEYPNLQTVDLSGSTCYEAIGQYISAHPDVKVRYTVSIGPAEYDNETTAMSLCPSDFDFETLRENLKWLPAVSAVEFQDCMLTPEQLDSIASSYPNVYFSYNVKLGNESYDASAVDLDLSWLNSEQLEEAVVKMRLLPGLSNVQLTAEDGSNTLSVSDVKLLQEQFPHVTFHYSFNLFGKTVSTSDERIEYDEVAIGNEGETEIRQALDILKACTYIKFDDCGIDSEVMAGIRDDYPDVKVVWRIHVDKFSMLTDETMIRMTHRLVDSNIDELKYATEVTYMDIGHNPKLTDISFVSYMPKLECVIVSGSSVTDISYFANCPNLTWLELCFCGPLEDISALSELRNLKYLNVSYTKVSDLTPLEKVPLERLNCMHTKVSNTQKNQFTALHPDCLSVFKGKQPYGYGWRYNDHGYTFFEYYVNMREVFRYDDENYTGNRKES